MKVHDLKRRKQQFQRMVKQTKSIQVIRKQKNIKKIMMNKRVSKIKEDYFSNQIILFQKIFWTFISRHGTLFNYGFNARSRWIKIVMSKLLISQSRDQREFIMINKWNVCLQGLNNKKKRSHNNFRDKAIYSKIQKLDKQYYQSKFKQRKMKFGLCRLLIYLQAYTRYPKKLVRFSNRNYKSHDKEIFMEKLLTNQVKISFIPKSTRLRIFLSNGYNLKYWKVWKRINFIDLLRYKHYIFNDKFFQQQK